MRRTSTIGRLRVAVSALALFAGSAGAVHAQALIGAVRDSSPLGAPLRGAFFDDTLLRTGLFARDRNISVLERPKPGYESLPLPVAGFIVTPSLSAGAGYTSNVYAQQDGGSSDEVFRTTAAFSARNDYRRGVIDLFGGVSDSRFADHGKESTTDAWVGGTAKLEIVRGSILQFGASFVRGTEDRATLQTPDTNAKPIRFDEARAFVGGLQEFTRLRLSEQLIVRDLSYDDSATFAGAPLVQSYRDRTLVTAIGRAEYAISPALSGFVLASANTRQFRNQGDAPPILVGGVTQPTLTRTSSGGDLQVGASFDIGGLARGEVAVGYSDQEYRSPQILNVSGVSGRGQIEYFPTSLITLTFTGERSIEDSTLIASGGYFASSVSARADYELLRQLILTAGVGYQDDAYRQIDRDDGRTVVSAGGRYLMNRAIRVNAEYQHIDQTSSGVFRFRDFTVDRIYAGLSYQF